MNEKIKSRKFIVWLVATILLVSSFVVYCIAKTDLMAEVCKILAESWKWVSVIYIGGNVAQKFTNKNGTSSISDNEEALK
jgi:hypothetical protein